ncbi:methyltransferase domain-containing protein [Hyphococcus luteus]|uniref:Methyltransferase type 11 domain-containing protein n=1 Tax=Hyphococcus luteus TaxID=2058213 RepID=A0A2S7JYR2_9PROT|nr:methyltransferase domain-containing protein [Marinicaulis flavus]PQA85380.1 hypothetical protein CW354_20745 [Marinicaulis flavus]
MTPQMFAEFEKILSGRNVGERVLEIGAVPTSDSLLNLKAFDNCAERVGVNLDGGESYIFGATSDEKRYNIVKANANDMPQFSDSYFDTIITNSVIEHDKFFWKTISEIKRIAKNGALIAIASPGYDILDNVRLPALKTKIRRFLINKFHFLTLGTSTLDIHNWPGDYYRFSPQCYREVLFEGMENVEVYSVMIPPRIIGIGYNKKSEQSSF